MNRLRTGQFLPRLALCLSILATAALSTARAEPTAWDDPGRVHTAFVGVDLLTMAGGDILVDQTVLVAGDRILAFGPAGRIPVPEGARRIEGEGATLMPGLIDMGVYGLDPHDQLPFLVHGATTIHHLRGSLLQLDWDAQIAVGEMVGPRIAASSNVVNSSTAQLNPPWFHADSVDDVGPILDNHVRRGFSSVRIGSSLSAEVYEEVLAGAARRGLPVIGDLPFAVGVEGIGSQAAILGFATIIAALHPDDFERPWGSPDRYFMSAAAYRTLDPARIDAVAARVAAAGVPVILSEPSHELQVLTAAQIRERLAEPALATIQPLGRWGLSQMADRVASTEARFPPDLAELSRANDVRLEMLRALYRQGVTFVPATVGGVIAPGSGLRDSIATLVAMGMSNTDALRSATVGAAEVLGQQATIGRIRSGMRADLLLVDGDPTADITALDRRRGAMVSGHWHEQADLDAALAARVDYYAGEDRLQGILESDGVDAARQWFLENRSDESPQPFRHTRVVMYVYGLTGSGELEKAEAVMNFLAEAYPDSWYVYDTLAYVHEQAGDSDAAIAAYRRSLELYPGNFSAVEGIAKLEDE